MYITETTENVKKLIEELQIKISYLYILTIKQ